MQPFPLRKTIGQAYAAVFGNLPVLFRAGALWVLLLVAVAALMRLVPVELPVPEPGKPIAIPAQALLLPLLANLVFVLGLNAIVVLWHRRVLQGVQPEGIAAPLDRGVLRYFLASILIALAITIPYFMFAYVVATLWAGPGGQPSLPGGAPAVRLVGLILWALATARIHLILPAIAIGDASMTVQRSWRLTSGYTLPLVIGLLATSLPITLVGSLLQSLLIAAGGGGSMTGFALAKSLDFIQAAVFASFLSLSFRFFSGRTLFTVRERA